MKTIEIYTKNGSQDGYFFRNIQHYISIIVAVYIWEIFTFIVNKLFQKFTKRFSIKA